ncbi:MAG: cbb3-type cytochrome c oxidase subunit I [Flavobacteriales bacterium]|nr:MAG: cbb3-type cytochrome c oxidase subunit I [Flavobacteriales bacterium]
MTGVVRWHVTLALAMLLVALVLGVVAALAYLSPEAAAVLPFQQLRPMHVSAALFWIITGASAVVMRFKDDAFGAARSTALHTAFLVVWSVSLVLVFGSYGAMRFGGREYWEFPPVIALPLLGAWLLLLLDYMRSWYRRDSDPPLYVWMWTTGVVFFLITFVEQNLWQIPWFRENYMRELIVQWKSNGAMVGAWNQMIYGTALYLMVRISGDEGLARGPRAFAFWFLGLSNLMFNWGHHLYNAPTASWIRHLAYGISMAEWVLLIGIVRGFRAKLAERGRFGHRVAYRFLFAAEVWVFLNLFLALLMSIPAINRYTHGTHITVAHAMGATIGINTMILLGALAHLLHAGVRGVGERWIDLGRRLAMGSLLIFWLALLATGAIKGWRSTALGITDHQALMQPLQPLLIAFAVAGVGVMTGLGAVAVALLRAAWSPRLLQSAQHEPLVQGAARTGESRP